MAADERAEIYSGAVSTWPGLAKQPPATYFLWTTHGRRPSAAVHSIARNAVLRRPHAVVTAPPRRRRHHAAAAATAARRLKGADDILLRMLFTVAAPHLQITL